LELLAMFSPTSEDFESLDPIDSCAYFKHYRWMRLQTLIAVLGVALVPLAHATAQDSPQSEAAGVEALMTRVGPPSQVAVDEFKNAGMEEVRPHVLTAPERAKVEVALASLPALNRYVLGKRLHSLAFVDGIPGEGTGLTSPDAKTGLYDITLRTSILDEQLTAFLTTKERRVFADDGSGITVTVKGTGTDALTYVLLHESTHVVDKSCGITADLHSPFVAGIWTSQKEMAPGLASSVAATTYFRGGHPIGVGRAATVYDALAKTPFVSLYATATDQEDLAELVAWREILKQHHGGLVVAVNGARGKTLRRWKPLTFPEVKRRFADVDRLLASPESCSGLS
jgi:hypothetical protein